MPNPDPHGHSNLEVLVESAEARSIALVLTLVSAGITLVAISFGIYAAIETVTSPAAAASITALIFAVLTGVLGAVVPALIRRRVQAKRRLAASRHPVSRWKPVLEVATVVGLAVAETVAASRNAKSARHRK